MGWVCDHAGPIGRLRKCGIPVTGSPSPLCPGNHNRGLRLWYSHRAFVAVSAPIDFTTDINDVISLFYMVGIQSMNKEELGWDPTEIRYEFNIGKQSFTTMRPLAVYGADASVWRSTRVYKAQDENGNIIAIKDSWRDEDHEPEGAILEKIFDDIRDKLGEKEAAEAD
ncbi:hypothetical protein OG21DRAFT_1525237 [Imleria badia]|nr:hypothetical protein OG21DRAFT_1525237 [Imleria badia]